MALRETRFGLIQSELNRLGCREVCVSFVGADERVLFVWGEEAMSCPYALARHVLLRLPSFSGDREVWDALKRVGHSGLV